MRTTASKVVAEVVLSLALVAPVFCLAQDANTVRREAQSQEWRGWFPGVTQTNLVANKPEFGAQILEANLQNAWGIAIRPAGFGGHFWVTANTTTQSIEYVGDVGGTPLFQDDLKVVDTTGAPTGVVFNAGNQFVITQAHPAGAITAPARFIFANDSGTVTAWTERVLPGGGFDRPPGSVTVADGAGNGSAFFGVGLSPLNDLLYAADFGADPQLRVYNGAFVEVAAFINPFQRATHLAPGEFAPFNVRPSASRGVKASSSCTLKRRPIRTTPTPSSPPRKTPVPARVGWPNSTPTAGSSRCGAAAGC